MAPRIVIRGGYSATNIGNGFYVKGAEYVLSKVCPEAEIITATNHPDYYWRSLFSARSSMLDYASFIPCDYLILLGPMLGRDYPNKFRHMYETMDLKKTRILLLSAGGIVYDQDEIDAVRAFLKEYPHYALFTRDRETYKNYYDLFEYSYDGICFALYASDYAPDYTINMGKYCVVNFEMPNEPYIKSIPNSTCFESRSFIPKDEVIEFKRKTIKLFNNDISDSKTDFYKEFRIIRTVHSCFPSDVVKKRTAANIYISDVARDYLNLYANAEVVFTDRLHASVACLSYGTPVFLNLDSPRCHLLERIGCEKAMEGILRISKNSLDEEKRDLIMALSDIIS